MNEFEKIIHVATIQELSEKISALLEGHNSFVGISTLSCLCTVLCMEVEMSKEIYLEIVSNLWDNYKINDKK